MPPIPEENKNDNSPIPSKGDVSGIAELTQKLLEERAYVSITDPKALKNAMQDLKGIDIKVTYEPDPYKAAEGANAIAILTEWEQYKTLDFQRIYRSMKKPAFIFDGRNILDHKKLYETGFNVYPIGKTPFTHFD